MLAVLALAAATLSACTPSPEPDPSPTAAFASEEEAFAAAEEVYRAYNDAYNQVDFSDPKTFEPLDEFTSGAYQAAEHEGLSQMHAEGVVRTGSDLIVWFRGVELHDDGRVSAQVCNDLSKVAVRDSTGKSLVSSDRPEFSALNLTFEVIQSETVLVESQAVMDTSCASS